MNVESNPFPRHQWVRLWCALPNDVVEKAAAKCAHSMRVDDIKSPEAGLALLTLRDGALAEPYYLGEIPLSRAHVSVSTPEGKNAEGAALIMDDRAHLARAMAILDAVLAAKLPGWESAFALLEEGARAIQKMERTRKAILATTQVDFSLLASTEGDEDE